MASEKSFKHSQESLKNMKSSYYKMEKNALKCNNVFLLKSQLQSGGIKQIHKLNFKIAKLNALDRMLAFFFNCSEMG